VGETNFNLSNNDIEQFNNNGDNVKVANAKSPVVVSGADAVQTTGNSNKIDMKPKEPESVWSKLFGWIKRGWNWIGSLFSKPS
jgi:hypothetical protein